MWVSVCVRGWVAKEGILSPASLKRCQSVQKTFFRLLWREDHTKSCARENLRDWNRRIKRASQLGVRLRSEQCGAEKESIRSIELSQSEAEKQSARNMESRHRAMKTMARWVSIFGSCVGLSPSSRVIHKKYTPECLKVPDFSSWVLQL